MADHGTTTQYDRGCRCDGCRAAQSERNRLYRLANRERIAAQKRAAHQADPEKVRARNVAYYAANKAEELARNVRYRAENSERIAAQFAERRAADTETFKQRVARYRRENRDKIRMHEEKRRALEFDAFVEKVDRGVLLLRDGDACSICGQPIDLEARYPDPGCITIDHVRPLSKGGEHSYANTALAHYSCNSRKNNRFDEAVA